MDSAAEMLEIQRLGELFLVIPREDLGAFNNQKLQSEGEQLLQLLETTRIHDVLVDFQNSDYFGSAALEWFVKLWKRISPDGCLAFCRNRLKFKGGLYFKQ